MADISSIILPNNDFYDLRDNSKVPMHGLGKNLLDNWYFMQSRTRGGQLPINQRAFTSSSSLAAYTIDRWATFDGAGTVSLSADGITMIGTTNYLRWGQQIPIWRISGKTVTLSVLLYSVTGTFTSSFGESSGNIINNYSMTGNSGITATSAGLYSVTCAPTYNSSYGNIDNLANIIFRITSGGSAVIQAAKLEYGEKQTLAHSENGVWVLNEIPNYNEELIKCQTSAATSTDTYANKSLATEQQLSYVETGTTASRAYVVDECFCWNGLLYRVKTAISSGSTFTPGTNCEQVPGGGFNNMSVAGVITTGSMHNIAKSGVYYIGSTVTDRPSANGGMYTVAVNGSLIAGLYVDVVTGATYSVNYINGAWYTHQL